MESLWIVQNEIHTGSLTGCYWLCDGHLRRSWCKCFSRILQIIVSIPNDSTLEIVQSFHPISLLPKIGRNPFGRELTCPNWGVEKGSKRGCDLNIECFSIQAEMPSGPVAECCLVLSSKFWTSWWVTSRLLIDRLCLGGKWVGGTLTVLNQDAKWLFSNSALSLSVWATVDPWETEEDEGMEWGLSSLIDDQNFLESDQDCWSMLVWLFFVEYDGWVISHECGWREVGSLFRKCVGIQWEGHQCFLLSLDPEQPVFSSKQFRFATVTYY